MQIVAVACGVAATVAVGAAAGLTGADGDAVPGTARWAPGRVVLVAVAAVAGASAIHQVLVARAERRADRARWAAPGSGGRGREHHFWPFVAGVALLAAAAAVASFLAGSTAAGGPGSPSTTDGSAATTTDLTPAVAAVAVAAALTVARLVVAGRAADVERGRAGWLRYLRRADTPVVPVALVEAIAVLGSLLAAAGSLAVAVGDGGGAGDGLTVAVDAGGDAERIATLAVAAIAAATALVVLALTRPLVVGTSAAGRDLEVIEAALAVDPSVLEVTALRTRNVGPDDLLVAARVRLDHALSLPEATEVTARVRRNLRHALPAARSVFLEVDVGDEWRAAPVVVPEHEPDHDVPDEIRERLAAQDPGRLGHGIPLERDAR